jgi:spermidine synthase
MNIIMARLYITIGYCFVGMVALIYQVIAFKLMAAGGLSDSISSVVSLTIFVSMSGLGAWLSEKVKLSYFGWIELVFAIYTVLFFSVLVYLGVFDSMTRLSSWGDYLHKVAIVVLLTPISVVSGMLIPVYYRRYEYLAHKSMKNGFNKVYFGFHIFAAAAIIIVEFILFPKIGWPASGLIASAIYLVFALISVVGIRFNSPQKNLINPTNKYPSWWDVKLFLLSVCTGFSGVLVYKLYSMVASPSVGNYSIVTSAIFLALGLSAFLASRFKFTLKDAFIYPAYGMVILLITAMCAVALVGLNYRLGNISLFYLVSIVAILIVIPPFSLIGLSIPIAVQHSKNPGHLIFIVSIGNAVGYWLYLVLAVFDIDVLLVLLMSMIVLLSVGRKKPVIGFVILAITVLGIYKDNYSSHGAILHESSKFAMRKNTFEYNGTDLIHSSIDVENKYSANKLGWPVNYYRVHYSDDHFATETEVFLSGGAITVNPSDIKRVSQEEAFVTIYPSKFIGNNDQAIILGAGIGISADIASTIYSNVDLIDLNPNTVSDMAQFSDLNKNVLSRVNLIQKDALSVIHSYKKESKTADFVLGTLTGSGYEFSAMFYTKEYFSAISSILSESGVFAFWMDKRSGKGYELVLNSLINEFKYIHRVSISPSTEHQESLIVGEMYHLLVASHHPLLDDGAKSELDAAILKLDTDIDEKYTANSIYDFHHKESIEGKDMPEGSMSTMERLRFAYLYKGRLKASIEGW